jgi:hypothetical protein
MHNPFPHHRSQQPHTPGGEGEIEKEKRVEEKEGWRAQER